MFTVQVGVAVAMPTPLSSRPTADIQSARAFAENLRRADVDPSTMLLYRLTGGAY